MTQGIVDGLCHTLSFPKDGSGMVIGMMFQRGGWARCRGGGTMKFARSERGLWSRHG